MIAGGETALIRAQDHVREASSVWNPLDAAACEKSCRYLQSAIEEVRAAKGAVTNAGAVEPVLMGIRGDLNRLARLVEAAHAFQRGLALYAPARSPESAKEMTV